MLCPVLRYVEAKRRQDKENEEELEQVSRAEHIRTNDVLVGFQT